MFSLFKRKKQIQPTQEESLKPFTPLNGDIFRYHTSWGGYDLTGQTRAILETFLNNGISLDVLNKEPTCLSSHIARFRFTFSDTRVYAKVLKLESQLKAALDDNNVVVTQSGKYIFTVNRSADRGHERSAIIKRLIIQNIT